MSGLSSVKKKFNKILGIIFLFFFIIQHIFFRENENYNIFLLIIAICIFTDIGGYIFGKILKGPKLTKLVQIKHMQGSLVVSFCL